MQAVAREMPEVRPCTRPSLGHPAEASSTGGRMFSLSLASDATRTIVADGPDDGLGADVNRAGPCGPARARSSGLAAEPGAQLPPGVTSTVAFSKDSPLVSSVMPWSASSVIEASYASGEGSFLMTPAPFETRTVWL